VFRALRIVLLSCHGFFRQAFPVKQRIQRVLEFQKVAVDFMSLIMFMLEFLELFEEMFILCYAELPKAWFRDVKVDDSADFNG